jgi:hypothetical protein
LHTEPDQPLTSQSAFPAFSRPHELAERLHLSPKTLAAWRQEGTGPEFISVSNRAVLYAGASVETWLAARKRKSTSGEAVAV